MATYASTQSSGIQMKWVLTRHRNLIIVSLSRGPGNFRLPMDHDRCAHWLSPVLVNLKWFRCAIRDSIIESKLSKMRRSAFKMFHIVTRVSNEEARISADSDLTRWPFVAGAAGNFQPARNHTVVRGVPSLSISFPFPVKAFIPLACTGIERSVMQRSLLPIKLPEDRTTTLRYGTCARETLCPHCQWILVPFLAHWRDPLRKVRKAQNI